MSKRDCDGEEAADSIPAGAWRGARRSGVLLPDTDTPLLDSVKAAMAPRRSSIIKKVWSLHSWQCLSLKRAGRSFGQLTNGKEDDDDDVSDRHRHGSIQRRFSHVTSLALDLVLSLLDPKYE
ncbi:hypothetical protein Baya_12254 [Bagarius yarrelli]|uniref:Uncharacterized protein n=1 Tax=Bagarius yarrelli TaxID=175774 RepID=A0A556V4P7_BAGYA|nr:hypothetical protein Baya_12254 [Bagarius yarrelli]